MAEDSIFATQCEDTKIVAIRGILNILAIALGSPQRGN
jgi:hypothetical protein